MTCDETSVLTSVDIQVDASRMSKVIMWNDDTTSMDAVVLILQKVFQKAEAEAVFLMLFVHTEGKAVVEECPRKLARAHRIEAMRLARQLGYPDFKITVEES